MKRKLCPNCRDGTHVVCWRILGRSTDCDCRQYCLTILEREAEKVVA